MDAFNNAQRFITDKTLFNKAGVYFQNNLLKALAGWDSSLLKSSNKESRKSITNAVEKLFRIPQEAGRAKIVFRQISDASSSGTVETEIITIQVPLPIEQPFKDFELQPLCKEASALIDLILTRDPKDFNKSFPPMSPPQSRAKSTDTTSKATPASKVKTAKKILEKASKKLDSKKNQFDEETDEVSWTESHESVGTAVAAYFPHPKTLEEYLTSHIFKGSITKYAPESFLDANDHLYHIVWEDGDEQDYDQDDFVSGRDLYDRLKEGWITEHESVGTRVAAHFPSGSRKKLFTGVVVRYCPATSADEADQLYHVIWEDWDEQDYDETELVTGKALYAERDNLGGVSSASKSAEKKKTSSSTSDSGSVTPTTASEKKKGRGRPSLNNDPGSKAPTAASRVSERNSRRTSGASDSGSITSSVDGSSHKKKVKEVVYIPPERVSERKSKKIANNDYVYSGSPAPTKPEPELIPTPEAEPEPEPIPWTEEHESVGSKVAQYFPAVKSTFIGKITKYAPPSTEDAADQLYHVVWEDGDENDYDEGDYQRGLLALKDLIPQHSLLASSSTPTTTQSAAEQLSSEHVHQPSPVVSGTSSKKKRKRASDPPLKPSQRNVIDLSDGNSNTANNEDSNAVTERTWIVDHPTVGMKVAAYFIPHEKVKGKKRAKKGEEISRKKVKTRPYIGKVVRYCLPSVSGADDHLYQILWDDGDQDDYNENDFLEGLALINKLIPLADDLDEVQSESGESLASMQVQDPEVLPIIEEEVPGSQTSAIAELSIVPVDAAGTEDVNNIALATELVEAVVAEEETAASQEGIEAMDIELVIEEKQDVLDEGGQLEEEFRLVVGEEPPAFELLLGNDDQPAEEEAVPLELMIEEEIQVDQVLGNDDQPAEEEAMPLELMIEEEIQVDQVLGNDNAQGVVEVAAVEDGASIVNLVETFLDGDNDAVELELAGENNGEGVVAAVAAVETFLVGDDDAAELDLELVAEQPATGEEAP